MTAALPDVTIDETLLKRADAKAREMNVSRSRLVEIALEKLLSGLSDEETLEDDKWLRASKQKYARTLNREEW